MAKKIHIAWAARIDLDVGSRKGVHKELGVICIAQPIRAHGSQTQHLVQALFNSDRAVPQLPGTIRTSKLLTQRYITDSQKLPRVSNPGRRDERQGCVLGAIQLATETNNLRWASDVQSSNCLLYTSDAADE